MRETPLKQTSKGFANCPQCHCAAFTTKTPAEKANEKSLAIIKASKRLQKQKTLLPSELVLKAGLLCHLQGTRGILLLISNKVQGSVQHPRPLQSLTHSHTARGRLVSLFVLSSSGLHLHPESKFFLWQKLRNSEGLFKPLFLGNKINVTEWVSVYVVPRAIQSPDRRCQQNYMQQQFQLA